MEKRKSILLVDDNYFYYDVYTRALQRQYNVTTAETLEEAEVLLQYKEFDLAIVDVMMPPIGLNDNVEYHAFRAGLEFYDSVIRKKYPKMPTILWSDRGEEGVCQEAKHILGEQVDNLFYCNKGEVSDLLNKIDNILNK